MGDFVKVASPYWRTLPESSITTPAFSANATNRYSPGTNRGIDLRDKIGHYCRPGLDKERAVIEFTVANGAVIFGFKCISHHNDPDYWPPARHRPADPIL